MGGEVKSMRTIGALICLGLLTAGCAATRSSLPPANGDKLYEAVSTNSAQQVSVIDSRSHATERRLPLGVPSRDWTHLYSITGGFLTDTDPQTGATLSTMALPGRYQLPPATISGVPGGTSPAGTWLVVEAFDQAPNSVPPATHMLLIDTTASKVIHTVDLAGYFRFDAISDDGLRLYLIQYLNGKEYYVRMYDVQTSSLTDNIVVDKSNGEQSMSGVRLSGIASPDGHWLYSMYVRENESPFIHALSLDGPFAFCLDLPGHGYLSSAAEKQWSLAMNHNGSRLYAVNGATGTLAEVDISNQFQPQITRTVNIPTVGSAGMGSGAVVSPDGKMLVTAGGSGIVWVDTARLTVRMRLLGGWHLSGVGLSPDGRTLYAVRDSGAIAEITMASGSLTATFDPAAGQPLALMRVAAS
jgi:DNA-binding beta-propeller fold protein YncE